jgi:calcineurin-like phosphoesterase family protein
MYFFISDEHYHHANIIKHCNRPFANVQEMNEELIRRHNEVVKLNDIVIHGGDFSWSNSRKFIEQFKTRLNGTHIFLKGSHDKWMEKDPCFQQIYEITIKKQPIIICHYAMLVWPRSHYNSWHLYGHSHGKLNDYVKGKCHDISVDNTNFYPLSEDEIFEIMSKKEDNFNLVKKRR